MNVLSLFDGISCGRVALERSGIQVDSYYASEIDKHAIKVTQDNYPDTIQLGDVKDWKNWDIDWDSIDLLIGGTPCQNFSIARTWHKPIDGLEGEQSKLFRYFLEVLQHLRTNNPDVYFLMENVKLKKTDKAELDQFINTEGEIINSSLVSFQNRERTYWTNVPYTKIEDRGISFQDYKEADSEVEKGYKVKKTPSRERMWSGGVGRNNGGGCANVTYSDKIYSVTTKQDRCPNSGLIEFEDFCRYLTREELEMAQTIPVGYTRLLSYHQACKVIGNGMTVDVIAHILKGIRSADMDKIFQNVS